MGVRGVALSWGYAVVSSAFGVSLNKDELCADICSCVCVSDDKDLSKNSVVICPLCIPDIIILTSSSVELFSILSSTFFCVGSREALPADGGDSVAVDTL